MTDKNTTYSQSHGQTLLDKMITSMAPSSVLPIIIVNKQGYILFINKSYEEWSGLKCEDIAGRHITTVVENTRTHIVASTGKAELQHLQKCFGKTVLANRIPIFDENNSLLGAWGVVDVYDISGITSLSHRITQLESQISTYERDLHKYRSSQYTFSDIIGTSPAIMATKKDAQVAAKIPVDILILGDPGTGKDLFAQAIHSDSLYASGPFVRVDCVTFSSSKISKHPQLSESHEHPYGDTVEDTIKAANGGTLFLDEIGDLSLDLQSKILHFIEQNRAFQVEQSDLLNFRVIATSNRDLKAMVKSKIFRADLYYMLAGYTLTIPSLKERASDIPALLNHFIDHYAAIYNRKKKAFTPAAVRKLMELEWAGNVRVVREFVKSTVIRTEDDALAYSLVDIEHFAAASKNGALPQASFSSNKEQQSIQDLEIQLMQSTLEKNRGNIRASAAALGIERNTLYRKIKKYNINVDEYRTLSDK